MQVNDNEKVSDQKDNRLFSKLMDALFYIVLFITLLGVYQYLLIKRFMEK